MAPNFLRKINRIMELVLHWTNVIIAEKGKMESIFTNCAPFLAHTGREWVWKFRKRNFLRKNDLILNSKIRPPMEITKPCRSKAVDFHWNWQKNIRNFGVIFRDCTYRKNQAHSHSECTPCEKEPTLFRQTNNRSGNNIHKILSQRGALNKCLLHQKMISLKTFFILYSIYVLQYHSALPYLYEL